MSHFGGQPTILAVLLQKCNPQHIYRAARPTDDLKGFALNRYPANVPENISKNMLKIIIGWQTQFPKKRKGSKKALNQSPSNWHIDCTSASSNYLLASNALVSTYTATSVDMYYCALITWPWHMRKIKAKRRVQKSEDVPTTLNQRAFDCTPLIFPLPRWLQLD